MSRSGEDERRAEREDEADDADVLGAVTLAREEDAAGDDQERAPTTIPAAERLVEQHDREADREERRRPRPSTEVRDAPASRIASVKSTCEMPGREDPGEEERPEAVERPSPGHRGRDEADAERRHDA